MYIVHTYVYPILYMNAGLLFKQAL